VEQAILLCKLIYHVVSDYPERHPEWTFVRHATNALTCRRTSRSRRQYASGRRRRRTSGSSGVPPAEVLSLLRKTRALPVPSRWYEAAPRSLLEAHAAGVPVAASRIGALPEAVEDSVTGLLADPDDPSAWAEAMDRLMDDSEAERLGEGAWQTWHRGYSPERGIRELVAAYEHALARRTSGG
jgi:glycosyltransferase involved in cell wall biosynthesis